MAHMQVTGRSHVGRRIKYEIRSDHMFHPMLNPFNVFCG